MTAQYAREEWQTELTPTGHERLPFMGPTGCIVAPHLRPWCTMHTCAINSLGFKIDDLNWTKQYFALRRKIEKLESKVNLCR